MFALFAFGFDLSAQVDEAALDGGAHHAQFAGVFGAFAEGFEFLDESVLASLEYVDVLAEGGGGVGVRVGVRVGADLVAEVGFEQGAPVGAEDAGGEEVVDEVLDLVGA
ncbi:MAG TPA: hypothetical protein VGX23_25455 [Actinocrinis sp.]|nr:hypothetical protein [Actinocrinis sp.]